MCSPCRRHAAQIRAIGTAVRSLFRKQGEDAKILERLQETILGRPETNVRIQARSSDKPADAAASDRPRLILPSGARTRLIVAHPPFPPHGVRNQPLAALTCMSPRAGTGPGHGDRMERSSPVMQLNDVTTEGGVR